MNVGIALLVLQRALLIPVVNQNTQWFTVLSTKYDFAQSCQHHYQSYTSTSEYCFSTYLKTFSISQKGISFFDVSDVDFYQRIKCKQI